MNKVLFLDRDGVINYDYGYVYKTNDLVFIKGIVNLIKKAKDYNYKVICITNQSGIARGLYSESDVHHFMKHLNDKLYDLIGTRLDKYYFCPHHPHIRLNHYGKKCICRKPSPGLFYKACSEFDINTAESICVGDKITDLISAEAIKINRLYLYSPNDNINLPKKYKLINSFDHVVLSN
ncbi:D-glycero-alpha-D-manno-heptose-1,7-bisphosphate 7-phosphatase [Prochlorococcus marinus]|uniref:D-glycero-alpha-D-manno-heptose-1,7-bisphosphate 7-phosphatase n=1 Tax=Prochlorococcus marinus TaxID=1219 RepID=UPI0022B311C6|nr:HAD family hydrolase [Prochlorococcus marinus]